MDESARAASPVRVGIVGCGAISKWHGAASTSLRDRLQFVACCDIQREAAEGWASRFGAESVYTDFDEMLREEELDGVLVTTWPAQHRVQVEAALRAGLGHVLCEKALTMTGQDALDIHALAADTGGCVLEGYMYRHHPATRAFGDLVASGRIGQLDYVRVVFTEDHRDQDPSSPMATGWRIRAETGGGVPHDWVCYAVNGCNHFADAIPSRVTAFAYRHDTHGIFRRLYGMIEYPNEVVGIVETSRGAAFAHEMYAIGNLGRLRLPIALSADWDAALDQDLLEYDSSTADSSVLPMPSANPFACQLEHFADVITGRAAPRVPLAESVVGVFTIEALVASAVEGRPMDVDVPAHIRDEWASQRSSGATVA